LISDFLFFIYFIYLFYFSSIFHRPQTFLFRRKGWARTFFKGRKCFSSGAKVGREHFS
jgi:hypothetical protein